MAEAVSVSPLTTETRVIPYDVCSEQRGTGAGFPAALYSCSS
jgi:hypothetical protein